MAAARERNDSLYDDRGGFGKFRKRPFRRVQATPYDRPSTAIRNTILASNSNNNNGWLSKLVDPAQRLITSSAHKLFTSVFRKRLPPPPSPQPLEPEANLEAHDKLQEAALDDPPGIRGSAMNVVDSPGSSSDGGSLNELELILKQKTFTRSEIDRLTALLQSRTVDLPVRNQEKISEVILSKAASSLDKKEFLSTPVKDNGLESHQISTPIISSNVLNEDVASPAELAKAYMGSRPSKISPSALGLRTRPVVEDSIAQIDRPFPSKSPNMSDVPRLSGHLMSAENGFVTPRSRGRSAIYSMARTPYSRVHSTSTLQGTGAEINVLGAQSLSSPGIWGSNRVSGSKQGALKRRSSVLDNDIGSIGPIRRIRQKSNLLPSGTLSIRRTGLGSDAGQQPSSSQKPVLASEPSMENGDNNIRGAGFTSVPSKSSEMASKILQQLDVLISSREKSPSKLSPSMLRGPALRSLDNVDSSKFLETVQDNNKLDVNHNTLLPNGGDTLSQKQDKVEENGPKLIASCEKSASTVNGVNATNLIKHNVSDVTAITFPVMDSVAQPPPQKRRAFQMSAHEDYLDLDDDVHPDRTASHALAEERERLDNTLAGNKISSAQAITLEKPAGFSQAKLQEHSTLDEKNPGVSDGSAVAEKSSGFSVSVAPLPGATAQQDMVEKQPNITSDKNKSTNDLSSLSMPSFGEKVVSPKEPNGFPPLSSFGRKTAGAKQMSYASTSSVLSDSTGFKSGTSSNSKPESSSSFTFAAADASKSAKKEPESDKVDTRNSVKAGIFSSTETVSSTSSATTGILSFGLPTSTSSLNGSLADNTTHSFSSSSPALISSNIFNQNSSGQNLPSSSTSAVVNSSGSATAITTTCANVSSGNSIFASASAPSFLSASAPSATVFKFGSTVVPPAPTSSNSAITGVELTGTKTTETGFKNSVIAAFGSSSSAINSTGNSIFTGASSAITGTGNSTLYGTSSVVASTEGNNLGGTSSTVANTGSGIFSFNAGASTSAATNQSQGFNPFSSAIAQTSVAGTVFATSTQSLPIQSGSSPSFGLTANKTFSSGGSLSSSTISSGATFGLPSTTFSEAISVSSITSPVSTTFGSSWPTPTSSIFVPAFTSASPSSGFAFGASSASNTTTSTTSTGFAFGASSASNTTTSTASMMFGSSNTFAFNSPVASPPSQPGFGNPSPAFTFAPSPSGNNDQMNMEDSMAEDTVQATTTTIQQPAAPLSTAFIFGSTGPSGANQFGSTPSGANPFGSTPGVNPFQFGSQPNQVPPQNPSQASGSLDVNGGGSFSLGTGGGDKSNRKFVRIRKTSRKK